VAGITSANVAIRRRTIAAQYDAMARDKRPRNTSQRFSLSPLRLSELQRLFVHRWGVQLPDDDAGADDLVLAFHQIAGGGFNVINRCIKWARVWAPWCSHADAAALATEIAAQPRPLKARALGERLGLTDRERTALKIQTIRPIDMTDGELVARRRQKDRERKAGKRRLERAAKPPPVSHAKPWESEGISRRTWYRRMAKPESQKRGTKSVRSILNTITLDGICATTPPAKAVGTPLKPVWYGVDVDGCAVVGNPGKRFKTRFPTSMRLSKEARAYALAACFDPAKVDRMFEMFRDCNIGMGSWSRDWDEVWRNWVDREVDIVNEAASKARARDYAMRQAA
jgi:hypothetical protein